MAQNRDRLRVVFKIAINFSVPYYVVKFLFACETSASQEGNM